jgi:hypothetical protein
MKKILTLDFERKVSKLNQPVAVKHMGIPYIESITKRGQKDCELSAPVVQSLRMWGPIGPSVRKMAAQKAALQVKTALRRGRIADMMRLLAGEVDLMFGSWLASLKRIGLSVLQKVQHWISAKTKPASSSQVLETAGDLLRSRAELVAENALLRQQVIVLKRSVKQPKLSRHDRWLMVLLSSQLPHWGQALLIIQPDTLLRWHRELFKWVWRRRSKHTGGKPPVSPAVMALIKTSGD